MMSLSSAYFNNISAAYGMAVEQSEILVLPASLIGAWQLKYASWNQFIIQTFRSRYDELLNAFESVAFNPMHERVKEYLQQRSKNDCTKKIITSHQTLANELGTTRVVISRILKQFEQEGMIKQFRGSIELK
jgi:CRP/FNR family transcriptional regulator